MRQLGVDRQHGGGQMYPKAARHAEKVGTFMSTIFATRAWRGPFWGACASLVLLTALAGCGASLPGLSTSALTGAAKPAVPQDDPTSRALQVGSTAARATKCGYNFDPMKLRTQFLAAEAAANPASVDQLGKIYDTAYNGVTKAVAGQGEGYCSDSKLTLIKSDLTRHLAGDYTATPRAAEKDEGLFGALTPDTSGDSEYAKKMQANPTLQN